jgi:phage-related holin
VKTETVTQYVGSVFAGLFANAAGGVAWYKLVLAAAGAAIVTTWTDTPEGVQRMLQAAAVMCLLDLVSGAVRGWVKCEFSSDKFGASFLKFAVYGMCLLGAFAMDHALNAGSVAVAVISTLIFVREATSFIENTGELGFQWPEALCKRITDLEESVDGDGKHDEDAA